MVQLGKMTLKSDSIQLQRLALTVGASRAITIDAKRIVIDERVQLSADILLADITVET